MRLETADKARAKGWYCGPWDSNLGISLGYANAGVDEPHMHQQMTEVYFMARGSAVMRVESETIELLQDQVLVVEPGRHIHFSPLHRITFIL